jgi:hypothetical protein
LTAGGRGGKGGHLTNRHEGDDAHLSPEWEKKRKTIRIMHQLFFLCEWDADEVEIMRSREQQKENDFVLPLSPRIGRGRRIRNSVTCAFASNGQQEDDGGGKKRMFALKSKHSNKV